jgi:hypothetical protein
MVDRRGPAVQIGDQTAGLANHQDASGDVPWGESILEEAIEPAACDVAEIERRGARAPQTGGAFHESRQHVHVGRDHFAMLERETRADQRARRVRDPGDANRLPILPCATILYRGEELPIGGVQHSGSGVHAIHERRDRDRVPGKSV